MRWVPAAVVALLQLVAGPSIAQRVELSNPGFEAGEVGALPQGWTKVAQSSEGFEISAADQMPAGGARCLALRYLGPQAATRRTWAAVEQGIDAAGMIGKRIRLTGMVRTEATEPWGGGALWLRITGADGSVLFQNNMRDRLVRDSAWTARALTADVPEGAARIIVGGLLVGGGDGWLDELDLEALGTSPKPAPPAPLSPRGLENLEAFARLVGVVRYFHPAGAGAEFDWDAFTAASLAGVENAAGPEELATSLAELFEPIAPGTQIFRTGSAPQPVESPPPGTALWRWRYYGYALSTGAQAGIYRRELVPIDAGEIEPGDRVWIADLPGGVSCRVPLAAPVPAGFRIAPVSTLVSPTGDDRWTRLADVMIVWNIMKHFHPYLAYAACDWSTALQEALKQAAVDTDASEFASTLRTMTQCLADGHVFVGFDKEDRSGRFPIAWRWIGEDLVVTGAENPLSGIKPGDRVLSIDGRGAGEALADLLPQISGSAQWAREQAPTLLALGSPGTTAEMQFEPWGGDPRKVVTRRRPGRGVAEPRPERLCEVEPGIWYVDLTRVTDEDFGAKLGELAGARGIVFDLRGYPRLGDPIAFFGHLSPTPLTSARWLVPVLSRPDQEGKTLWDAGQWTIEPVQPYFAAKKAFLTDGRAISYAESCMEIVKHFGVATIVGAPTAGANGNVIRVALPGGYGVTFTGMFVEHLDGSRFHGVGVLPDVSVEPTREGIATGRDEVLEAGMAVVRDRGR